MIWWLLALSPVLGLGVYICAVTKPTVYVQPSTTTHNTLGGLQPEKLRILDLNCHGVPFQPKERQCLTRLKIFINNHIESVDVIVLQELFTKSFSVELRDLFDSIKWSHTELVHARFPKIGSSGLLVASRWPIYQTRGVLFGGGTGPDAFADKGILSLTLDINGAHIRISNTHIQNPDEVMGKQVTNRQLNDVIQHVGDSDIVLGDFNVEPEYNPITYKHHWKYLVCPNVPTFGLDKESKTIDYAYSHLDGNATALEDSNVSDHKPIIFTFDYSRN